MATVLTKGIALNNPGLIPKVGNWHVWQSLAPEQTDPDCLIFLTPVDGLRGIAKTLLTYYDSRMTGNRSQVPYIQQTISHWSASVDLNSGNLQVYEDLRPIVENIVRICNGGQQPYSASLVDEALRRVGVVKAPPARDMRITTAVGGTALGLISQFVTQIEPAWTYLSKIHEALPHIVVGIGAGAGIVILLFVLIERLLARRRGIA